jgi:hypothetical protein
VSDPIYFRGDYRAHAFTAEHFMGIRSLTLSHRVVTGKFA